MIDLIATPPATVLLVLLTPAGAAMPFRSADVFAEAERIFSAAARVRVVSAEQVGLSIADLDACPAEVRSSCWARTALRVPDMRALVVLSIQPGRNEDYVGLVAVDLTKAQAALADLPKDADPELAEAAIWRLAIRSPSQAVLHGTFAEHLRGQEDLSAFLGELAPLSAFWTVTLRPLEAGSEISIDGRSLGVVSAGEARIVGVPSGAAKIEIAKPDGAARIFELEIAGDQTIELERAPPPPSVWPTALVISGAVAAAVGAGTIIAGVALADRDVSLCVVRDRPSECDGAGPKFEDGPGGLAQPTGADASPPWALIVGTGFATLGVTLAAGAFAFADFEDAHWWVIAGSVALGIAGSGIAYAVNAN